MDEQALAPGSCSPRPHSFSHRRWNSGKAGLPELIAGDVDQYVQRAVHRGFNAEWRRQVTARMKQGATRVFNDMSAVCALEDFLADAVVQAQPVEQAV
jgi:hypothetical protein